jgi:hypothetical protein
MNHNLKTLYAIYTEISNSVHADFVTKQRVRYHLLDSCLEVLKLPEDKREELKVDIQNWLDRNKVI